ncbi:MAG: TetR/AcrR family transcriptional regulator [Sciscionella sp.]
MIEATRREQPRTDTERHIREQARKLLVQRGAGAVTLRAIARELGITAPALYRYYNSREDLIQHVCLDICADLAEDLACDLARMTRATPVSQVFELCRGFRRWALAHPKEFTLVFASPATEATAGSGVLPLAEEPFGRIFLTVAGRVLASSGVVVPADPTVPEHLRHDLAGLRESLLATLHEEHIEVPPDTLSLGMVRFMLHFWVRLYGHVALEVFGRFPFGITDTEPLFESMLADLAAVVGLALE